MLSGKDSPSQPGHVDDPVPTFVEALFERHLERLTFSEVRKALQALSSLYVERREKLREGQALGSDGKRAAFALYYGPLHLLTVRDVVRALAAAEMRPPLVDLGCGTGVSAAGWALAAPAPIEIVGVEKNGWAAGEARFTFASLGLRGRVVREDVARFALPPAGAILLAYTVNELDDDARDALLPRLVQAARTGSQVLVVEPIARRGNAWWNAWSAAFSAAGGRDDDWRFKAALPERLRLLAKAAGLDATERLARSLYLPGARLGRPA